MATKQRGFFINPENCTACKACEIACKTRNQLGVGPRLRRVTTLESGAFPDLKVRNISLACMHCEKPSCMAVCPAGAITKRPDDGIVVVNRDKCIACHACGTACPFGVPQYTEDGKMTKCDLCAEFLAMGKEPACVHTCFYDALHSGTLEELSKLASEKEAIRIAGITDPAVYVVK